MNIQLYENNLYLDINVTEDGDVRLYNLSPSPFAGSEQGRFFRLLEVQGTGFNQNDHHGSKHTGTQPGSLFRYANHTISRNQYGNKLELKQKWRGLFAVSHLQFYDDIPVVRSWTELENYSEQEDFPLEYISSFVLTGLYRGNGSARDADGIFHIPHSTWFGEAQWKAYTIQEMGYDAVHPDFSLKRISLSSTGSWPCSEHLPMGGYENSDGRRSFVWQIETAAAWGWEASDIGGELYLQIHGPSFQESGFFKRLKRGEHFQSVPCAIASVNGGFQEGIRALTKYRRVIRRKNTDNQSPSVIFNDYMNCLMGDPTTEKELPLIDAAASAGCRYYCVDCGWYDDGPWWDGVGQWLPGKARFPNGIHEVLDRIRARGMIPGLWLELEVMGIECPLVKNIPKDWLFQRNGLPIIDHSRYQLDFRNPEVIVFANNVIDRLVGEYGAGYIKMDYNINSGAGTDRNADSAAAGLLEHTRAYLAWLDTVFKRYPELVIENCGSGGMRMEYSLLSRHSIQSVSDQTDYLRMAAIACNCMTAVTPEQAAIWSYPLAGGDVEETVFNMVNAILLRIHQSGHLANLKEDRMRYVREGIAYHKSICTRLKEGLPFWPLGLASFSDKFLCAGIECGTTRYLALWCTGESGGTFELPIPAVPGKEYRVKCSYPEDLPVPTKWELQKSMLTVTMKGKTARILEMTLR
ncbi:MAG: alpha-galactosidase [Treponema sp.]|jgi:alpha-galactosidase|nr:alpha-galactosidase [Treponema sp.]